jgi:hypothetical protein
MRTRRFLLSFVAILLALTAGAAVPAAAQSSGATTTTTTAGSGGSTPAVTGNECPFAADTSKADFFPIQPSFSAGYTMTIQNLTSDTAGWGYEITADFPYSNWTSWYLYNEKGVPLFKWSDTAIVPDSGSTNPFVAGNPILASPRHFHLYFMPATTPAAVVQQMEAQGQNVALLPALGSTPAVSIVSRSYWSLANDGLGNYDRFGYGGPTNTPYPVIQAFETDPQTGALTTTPVSDCGAQSVLPQKVWYDAATGKPLITFENAPRPTDRDLADIPHFLVQTGSGGGSMGEEFPPSPVADEIQFYRNVAANAPYADVSSAPAAGNPPDACGGYVMANVPNDVVSIIHVPRVPSFPNYTGATDATLNNNTAFEVQFYSLVVYGATKQVDAVGKPDNSQLGNTQIGVAGDGSATFVLWPQSASSSQQQQIAAVAKANGWNLLRSGQQTATAPNLVVVREKGQNKQWANALSANDVTQGAPCPQSTDPSVSLPQDPPGAAVTQFNGMGLTAPQGQNCSIKQFLSGKCLATFEQRLAGSGAAWSSTSIAGPKQKSA